MAIAASSTLFYIFVKSEPNNRRIDVAKEPPKSENELEEVREKGEDSEAIENDSKANEIAFLERQSKLTKRVIGISLALMTGTLFSQFNTPVLYTHQQFNK